MCSTKTINVNKAPPDAHVDFTEAAVRVHALACPKLYALVKKWAVDSIEDFNTESCWEPTGKALLLAGKTKTL